MRFFWRQNKNLNAIYAMHSIESFAMSLIGIFIPIYFLTLGYSVAQIFLFFIVYYFIGLISAFLAIYIASKISLQRTFVFRFPFLFVFLALLFLLKDYSISIYILAAIGGFQNMLYWTPLNILFARNTKSKEIGSSTGKLFAFPKMMTMFGPLIGGLIAAKFGFQWLIIVVFVFLVISILPLLSSGILHRNFSFSGVILNIPQLLGLSNMNKHNFVESIMVKPSFNFEISKGVKLFKKYKKYFVAEVFDNMGQEVEAIIWPIFVYLSLLNITSVGLVGTLLSLSSIIFTLFVGKISDKNDKKRIIKIGAILLFLVWLLRYFVDSEITLYLATILAGFFTVLFLVPFTSLIFEIGKRNKDLIDEFFVFREIPVFVGRLIILSLGFLFAANVKITFPIAGLAYLYFLFF